MNNNKKILKDYLKGKTIVKSDGRNMNVIYDDYKVMDGSYYCSDINTEMKLSPAGGKGESANPKSRTRGMSNRI